MKKLKVILSLLLMCSMVVPFSGVAGAEDADKNPMPIVTEPVTLTVATYENPYSAASLTQNLPVWAELEKTTGVHIEWEVLSTDQYPTAMQTRLAAGINLPDIIDMPVDAFQYGVDGIVLPLDDLIAEYGQYIQQAFDEKPMLKGLLQSPGGVTYHLSSTRDEEIAAGPYGWVIRKDWLDKLGLEEPKTTDDWYNVLLAFKTQDPNGNGLADEIPMTNYNYLAQMLNWGNAWGLHLRQSEGFYPDAEGHVQYEFTDPRAKEMLMFMNKLYEEGLYDMEAITNKRDQFTARMTSDIAGAAIAWQETTTTWNGALKESGIEDANWVMTNLPYAEGYEPILETAGLANSVICISKNCENPEVAFRWLDYVLYSDEAARLMTLGIEGETYNIVDGEIVMTEFVTNNPDGLGAVEAVRSIGAWQFFPFRLHTEYVTKLKLSDPDHVLRAAMVEPYIVDKFEYAVATQEEQDATVRKLTDISTYTEEMYTKFITGKESFDNWDKYVQTISDLGIGDIIAVRQAQYDRLLESVQ